MDCNVDRYPTPASPHDYTMTIQHQLTSSMDNLEVREPIFIEN